MLGLVYTDNVYAKGSGTLRPTMRVSVRNFRALDAVDVEFSAGRLTLLRGPSGRGKTTLLEAISWVLYGGKRGLANLVGGKREVVVRLEDVCGLELVERGRCPGLLRVVRDGRELRDDRAQALLCDVFGDSEQFEATGYLCQKTKNSLLSLKPKQRRDVLQQLVFSGELREQLAHFAEEVAREVACSATEMVTASAEKEVHEREAVALEESHGPDLLRAPPKETEDEAALRAERNSLETELRDRVVPTLVREKGVLDRVPDPGPLPEVPELDFPERDLEGMERRLAGHVLPGIAERETVLRVVPDPGPLPERPGGDLHAVERLPLAEGRRDRVLESITEAATLLEVVPDPGVPLPEGFEGDGRDHEALIAEAQRNKRLISEERARISVRLGKLRERVLKHRSLQREARELRSRVLSLEEDSAEAEMLPEHVTSEDVEQECQRRERQREVSERLAAIPEDCAERAERLAQEMRDAEDLAGKRERARGLRQKLPAALRGKTSSEVRLAAVAARLLECPGCGSCLALEGGKLVEKESGVHRCDLEGADPEELGRLADSLAELEAPPGRESRPSQEIAPELDHFRKEAARADRLRGSLDSLAARRPPWAESVPEGNPSGVTRALRCREEASRIEKGPLRRLQNELQKLCRAERDLAAVEGRNEALARSLDAETERVSELSGALALERAFRRARAVRKKEQASAELAELDREIASLRSAASYEQKLAQKLQRDAARAELLELEGERGFLERRVSLLRATRDLEEKRERLRERQSASRNLAELEEERALLERGLEELRSRVEDAARGRQTEALRKNYAQKLLSAKRAAERESACEKHKTAASSLKGKTQELSEVILGERLSAINQELQDHVTYLFSSDQDAAPRLELVSEKPRKSAKKNERKTSSTITVRAEYKGFVAYDADFFSGGEYDRVALCLTMALAEASGGRILLLDETLASLDEASASRALQRLSHWAARTGTTVLLVAHQLEGAGCETLEL